MKTPSSDLFLFIKSMTSAEKRYFKKDTKDSNTSDLFDIVNEQQEYDEDQVKKRLKDSSFAHNLKVHKNRLQQILLKNLRSYYEEKSAQSKIKVLIDNGEIFLKKQLYDMAYGQLDKALQLCEQYEEYELMLVVLGIRARMASYFTELSSAQETPMMDMEQCAAIIQNYVQHAIVNKKILHFLDVDSALLLPSEIYPKVKDLIEKEIVEKKREPLSPIAERMYLHSQALMYNTKGDLRKSCELTKQIIERFEANPFIVEEKNAQYFNCLVNHLSFLSRADSSQKEVEQMVHKILQHATLYEHLMPNMIYIYNPYIESLRKVGHFSKVKALIETDLKDLIARYQLQDVYMVKVTMAMAIESYIALGDYDTAGTILRDILNSKHNLPKDFLYALYILELIYHFDQGDYLFIENLVAAHQKRVRRNNEQFLFFESVLSFFKKISSSAAAEQKNIFQLHKISLPKFEDDPISDQLGFLFNYACWIEAHTRRVPYALLLEERKHLKNNFLD